MVASDDKRERRRTNAAHAQSREDYLNGLRQCLSTGDGRWFLWELLGRTELFHDAFSAEPTSMAYIVGRQAIGKMLLADIGEIDPGAWVRMVEESNERRDRDQTR